MMRKIISTSASAIRSDWDRLMERVGTALPFIYLQGYLENPPAWKSDHNPIFLAGTTSSQRTRVVRLFLNELRRRYPHWPHGNYSTKLYVRAYHRYQDRRDTWVDGIVGLGVLVIRDVHMLPADDTDPHWNLHNVIDRRKVDGRLTFLTGQYTESAMRTVLPNLVSRFQSGLGVFDLSDFSDPIL